MSVVNFLVRIRIYYGKKIGHCVHMCECVCVCAVTAYLDNFIPQNLLLDYNVDL